MKLSVKLTLSFGFLIAVIVFGNMFSISQLRRLNDGTTAVADVWLPSLVSAQELNTIFSDFRIAEIQHAVNTSVEEMQRYENMLTDLGKRINQIIQQYSTTNRGTEEEAAYQSFLRFNAEYSRVHNTVLALSQANKNDEAMALLNGESRELYQKCTNELNKIVAINLQGTRAAKSESADIYENSSFSLFSMLIASFFIGVALLVFITRGILKQLGKDPGILMSIAQRVTDGDFNIADGSPAIGVYGNIVRMVGTLEENIAKAQKESEYAQEQSHAAQGALKSAEIASNEAKTKTESMLVAADKLEAVANIVSSASTQLSAQIEQSERGAAEQAGRVTETATAMEEMNSTVLEVAKNAGQASDVSISTRQKAEAGAEIVRKAVTSIRQVQEHAVQLKEDMTQLDENAQSISQIMGVISDIADQTNLLALNAAIEAARAGEAGRGFAVVADEVRKLAEKTMASTTDVGNAIRAIQTSASRSMAQVDTSAQSIEEATEYANQSGVALREIVSMVDQTADQVRAIATAAEQQSASSEEINQSITQVNSIAGETARAMQEAAHAVSDLAGQAQVLARLIDDMKQA